MDDKINNADTIYNHALNFIDNIVILNDASLVFNPIELNDLDHVSPLDEIDPDLNFYNYIHYHIQSNVPILMNYHFNWKWGRIRR